jgi:predicted nucleotidyltransferase
VLFDHGRTTVARQSAMLRRPRPTIVRVDGQELVDSLRAAAAAELPSLPVVFAYLFGSRTGRHSRPDSDVDVGIVVGATDEQSETIAFRVADVLAARSRVGGIEVTVLDDAPIRFLGRVLRSRVVLYSRDEPARVEFESRVGRMADDVEVWAAPLDRDLLGAIADGRR